VECRSVGAVDETTNQEEDEEEVDVGTVWTVGVVDVMHEHKGGDKNTLSQKIFADINQDEPAIDICRVGAMEVDGENEDEGWQTKISKKNIVKVTLDSGAGASCWPEKLWRSIPMNPKTKGVKFAKVNGAELKYYGNKCVRFMPKDKLSKNGLKVPGGVCEMKFHVTDTTKPLASALAVVKMGNKIVLDGDFSYIENKATGERVVLKESGGTYVFEVEAVPEA
jgi:hypothetical protein